VQQRRLARTAGAHQRHDLAGGDVDVGPAQGLGGAERAHERTPGEKLVAHWRTLRDARNERSALRAE
jgi:hypothetical protein